MTRAFDASDPSLAARGTGGGAGNLPPLISVIVPVFNRSGPLRCFLGSIARQTFPLGRFEVILCDDGSTEDLLSVVRQSVDELGLRVRYLRQENQGPGPARNLGLAYAAAEIVAFTDSDCIPSPGWLESIHRGFADPGTTLAGGPVLYREADHLSGRCVNFLTASTLGAAGATNPESIVHMEYYPRTLNLAVRRDLALEAGGFPAHSHGEDLEFSHRVSRPSQPPHYLTGAEVLHNERRSLVQVFRENLRKGAARIRLRRNCGMHQSIHILPALVVLAALALPLLAIARHPATAVALIACIAYTGVLGILAVQGAFELGEARAIVATPAYAVMMHFGYGIGYLGAALGLSGRPRPQEIVDWRAVRARATAHAEFDARAVG